MNKKVIRIIYTNYKDITKERKIIPIEIEFKKTPWHQEKQWILTAFDVDKQEERGFALKDIKKWDI